MTPTEPTGLEIAIVGMACRFPGASTIEAFWHMLRDGRETIRHFSDTELQQAGVPAALLDDPNTIKASGVLADIEQFDAAFFGFTPREACATDPQHRLFLECAWEALEHAGYDPSTIPGAVGIFGGAGLNSYQHHFGARRFAAAAEDYARMIGNAPDFLVTRIAYKLNLEGPAVTVQTACSTALVAIHLACQSLIGGECTMALAGGVSVRVPQITAYQYQEGSILSPDGRCRPFAADANGTVVSSGAGMVVLKRLEDAHLDGDTIYAVIKGSAINNDGSSRVGFTAPGVEGQERVIRMAHQVAEVPPDTISYIEAHGTGTVLGDPIEVAALTRAFRAGTNGTARCTIGSLKSNIGHTDAAAGVAGLIKTTLALYHRIIPPGLNCSEPNPQIDLAHSPFSIQTHRTDWPTHHTPCRAGVSAFGMGGTNAHVVLEAAPEREPSAATRPWHLLLLSARTATALDTATVHLAHHLMQHRELNLADVAYTLQVGRRALPQRRMLVCQDRTDALPALETRDPKRMISAAPRSDMPSVVFLFSGQGAQYIDMARDLYATEPLFREQVDACADILVPHLGRDIRDVIYPDAANAAEAATQLQQTALTQPALFVIEYALAQLWMAWGVQPRAMVGHSIGEYVAACLAGVFSLETALALVAARGQLMQTMPPGAMLAVPLPPDKLHPLLRERLSLAAVNAPAMCVVAGEPADIDTLQQQLTGQGIECRRLNTSHAFHSTMMAPIVEPFTRRVAAVERHPPRLAYLSNVTGTWITSEEATAPDYWARHLRQTVQFAENVRHLVHESGHILLEVGPGHTLSKLIQQHPASTREQIVLSSLRHPREQQSDVAFLLTTLGKLWLNGVKIDWSRFAAHERRMRVPLPTYPFERQRYWIDAPPEDNAPAASPESMMENDDAKAGAAPPAPHAASAAQTPTEQQLMHIWQQLLGYANLDRHDHFFDLGGDSLLALQLIARIRTTSGVELPPQQVMQTPTIAELAATIDAAPGNRMHTPAVAEASLSELLVPFATGGQLPALFLIHPVGGGIFGYRDLVHHLHINRPVYAIQAQGFADEHKPLGCVPAMAQHYLEIIADIQATGPYLLVGHSFGGAVAFEMACQLHARHQPVAFLALLDTPDLTVAPALPTDDAAILASMLGAYLDDASDLVESLRQMPIDQQLAYTLAQARSRDIPLATLDAGTFQRLFRLVQTHLGALRAYHPQPYAGSVVYLRAATRDPFNPPHPEHGWIPWAPAGITISEVPGTHTTMLHPPHVETLAARLRHSLKAAMQCEE